MNPVLVLALALVPLIAAKLYPIEYRVPLAGKIPSPGDVWPQPQSISTTDEQFTVDKAHLHFMSNLDSCDIISKALTRYQSIIFIDSSAKPAPGLAVLEHVDVRVTGAGPNCAYPKHEEDESYQLAVPAAAPNSNMISITAQTVWGALRGLETLSQLIYTEELTNYLLINATVIDDRPRFAYRGVLLDTARHYLPKRILLSNLDAMAFNKFNAFHWHLADDQSFPFVSTTFGDLHVKGAYTPKHIYTPADVQEVIEYARLRGIRVIPEIGTPGHTHGMARAYPDLLTPCWKDGQPNQPNFPLNSESELINPMRNESFDFLRKLYEELKATFKDEFIHLGMDEAFYACWASNPDIATFMREMGMTEGNYHELEQYYVERTLAYIKEIGYKYIIWQDPLENGVVASPDSIIGVWKDTNLDSSMRPWQEYILEVAEKNYEIILSACWYLNYIDYPYPGMDWEILYHCDPRNFSGTDDQKNLVIGGQANIWGEFVDQTNILSRFWPRASAVGERLWSNPSTTQDVDDARHRLDLHRCRMLRRGIPAAPILNGYCGEFEVDQTFDGPGAGAGAMSPIGSFGVLLICLFVLHQWAACNRVSEYNNN